MKQENITLNWIIYEIMHRLVIKLQRCWKILEKSSHRGRVPSLAVNFNFGTSMQFLKSIQNNTNKSVKTCVYLRV